LGFLTPSMNSDTIVAISSPAGRSSRGIIRLSGPDAFLIAGKLLLVFEAPEPPQPKSHIGQDVLIRLEVPVPARVFYMKAPKSFTREDSVEFHTLGAPPLLDQVILGCLSHGARLAEPGEFTRRAFMNGRIDLTQAEAVSSLIRARSDEEGEMALRTLEGELSRIVKGFREDLVGLLAEIEAAIDFVDDEVPMISHEVIDRRLQKTRMAIDRMMHAPLPRPIPTEGVQVSLVGRTNVGKSSLLNRLSGIDRAIVSEESGTTRDPVALELNLRQMTFRLVDTAGWKTADDDIDKAALARTEAMVSQSQCILLVLDGSQKLDDLDEVLMKKVPSEKRIIVINKTDLPRRLSLETLLPLIERSSILAVSARTGTGIESLKQALAEEVGRVGRGTEPFFVSRRQQDCLALTQKRIISSQQATAERKSLEFIALEIKETLQPLGEITGEVTNEEILDRIFSEFCIGK